MIPLYSIKDHPNNLAFSLNEDNKTATIAYSEKAKGDIFVPKSIFIDANEYLIIGIENYAFFNNISINSISFADDSELESIGEDVFFNCSIKKLSIPACLKHLKEGWCNKVSQLTEIEISPENELFTFYDDKILISKTETDVILLFASRNVETVLIPSNITRIGEYSFSNCFNLKSLSFSPSSKLRTISKNSFTSSRIEEFSIPKNVIDIEEGWCDDAKYLVNLHLSSLNKNFVYFQNKILLKNDTVLFASRSIQKVSIPSNVKNIGNASFQHCHNLVSISFENMNLIEKIGKKSFMSCWNLKKFPPISKNLTIIDDFAFYSCKKIDRIDFPSDSSLQKIGSNAFGWCFDLFSITGIPQSTKEINKSCFVACVGLRMIEFLTDEMSLDSEYFRDCSHLAVVCFPNIRVLNIRKLTFSKCANDFTLLLNANAQLNK